MSGRRIWTRREFGQAAAAAAVTTVASRGAFGFDLETAFQPSRYALFGSVPHHGAESGAIHVFRVTGEQWIPVEAVAAAAPAHLLLHPKLSMMYAVHNVGAWGSLPRGAVSSYHFDRNTGRLAHLQTTPLSLSATHPRHAVLTADGSHLCVAAEGGGIYNLLPLTADGSLQPVSSIRKEFGSGEGSTAKPAAPHTLALLPDGSLLAADTGQETLTHFTVDDGSLTLRQRTRVHTGSGPAGLVLSPGGKHVYTVSAGQGDVRRYRLAGGRALEQAEFIHDSPVVSSLAVSPCGNFLLLSDTDSLTVLRVDPKSGTSTECGGYRAMGSQLLFHREGTRLLGLDATTGTVRQAAFDAATGSVSGPDVVAQVRGATSLLLA